MKALKTWLAKEFEGIEIFSKRNQRQLAWLALVTGLIATGGGILGIWMQGRVMYDGTPLHMIYDVLCYEDVYTSISLASLVTSFGMLMLSWVILASKLTEKFSTAKRNALFGVAAIVLLSAIAVVSRIAAKQDWARAEAASNVYFENQKTNSPSLKSNAVKPR